MDTASFAQAGIFFVILLCSLALHEFGHAWVADKRGDPLPRAQKRVTLDPFSHLDPIGSFLIPGVMIFLPLLIGQTPFALIGWGRPVQISLPNPETRRTDDILITLAGPGVNVAIALAASLAAGVAEGIGHSDVVIRLLLPIMVVNVALAAFNLIPIPPLDGSRLLRHVVNMSERTYAWLASNGWWVLLILINVSVTRGLFQDLLHAAVTPFLMLGNFVAGLFAA
ncbi:MAG: site-2 protease family protein [Puniceicoccales bacterium]|jgi:Zn-dependent protease|nr:site-2 protease family protein [Puniceicoccales bacterium]